jgi:3',5'-cyclic-AMP phosphodiesterase
MGQGPLRIIQISDTHLFGDQTKSLLGVPTQKSFEAVLDLIKPKIGQFDLIIHSGDLAQDYSMQAYKRLAEMLTPFKVPVYCIPGNHDDPKLMAAAYPLGLLTNNRHIISKDWQIILLDSHKPDAVEGYLAHQELKFMEHCLKENPDHHAIVLFHHQPVPVGSRWLDNLGLSNADEVWKIAARFPKIKAVVFGHVHQVYETEVNKIKCFSAPSTCFQFKRKQDHFGIEKLSPGYRWINLFNDGRIETNVVRTDKYIGEFDEKSTGY